MQDSIYKIKRALLDTNNWKKVKCTGLIRMRTDDLANLSNLATSYKMHDFYVALNNINIKTKSS